MRVRSIGATLAVLLLGIAGPVFAQGGDVNEEVRRAVERAVGSSVSSSVAESLSRSIVSEGIRQMPKTTVFGSPFYNRTDGDFSFGSFEADTFGITVGALHKVNDFALLHIAVAGAGTSVDVEVAGTSTSIDARLIDLRLGVDLVFLNTEPVKGWFTFEGGASNFDTDLTDDIWAVKMTPSATLSIRGGPILFEPTVGFSFTRPFVGVHEADTAVTFQPGFSLKYRGEKLRPQLNFAYAKVIRPSIRDDGVISVGPEILYAVTPELLIGGAYSYSTPLAKGIDVNSHTVTLEVRWIF